MLTHRLCGRWLGRTLVFGLVVGVSVALAGCSTPKATPDVVPRSIELEHFLVPTIHEADKASPSVDGRSIAWGVVVGNRVLAPAHSFAVPEMVSRLVARSSSGSGVVRIANADRGELVTWLGGPDPDSYAGIASPVVGGTPTPLRLAGFRGVDSASWIETFRPQALRGTRNTTWSPLVAAHDWIALVGSELDPVESVAWRPASTPIEAGDRLYLVVGERGDRSGTSADRDGPIVRGLRVLPVDEDVAHPRVLAAATLDRRPTGPGTSGAFVGRYDPEAEVWEFVGLAVGAAELEAFGHVCWILRPPEAVVRWLRYGEPMPEEFRPGR